MMKLNDENYEQSSFTHKRVILCLLWLRSRHFAPDALRTSFRDMVFVGLEHYYSEKMSAVKALYIRIRNKLAAGRN